MTLLAAAALSRRGRTGTLLAGAALIARGASGFCPITAAVGRGPRDLEAGDTRQALSGSGGTRLAETVTIARPAGELFRFWRDLSHLPLFMRHIDQVAVLDDVRSRWTARGPGDMVVTWDAEIINEIPDALIAWRSLPGADVVSAGSVNFRPVRAGTQVDVLLQYNPPGGRVGASLAWLMGRSPRTALREDLRQLKQLFEAGEVPSVAHQPTGRRSRMAGAWMSS